VKEAWMVTVCVAGLLAACGDESETPPTSAVQRALVEEDIPHTIKSIAQVTQQVISIYDDGTTEQVDVKAGVDAANDLFHPSAGPTIDRTLALLNTQLAKSGVSNTGAAASDERYGQAASAFNDLVEETGTGFTLANADTDSLEPLAFIEASPELVFNRPYNKDATAVTVGPSGHVENWSVWVGAEPEVSHGNVYDWRLGLAEYLYYLAIRIHVIAGVDPNWKADGAFSFELHAHERFLTQQLTTMNDGIKCVHADKAKPAYDICADIYSGIYAAAFHDSQPATDMNGIDALKQQLVDKLPLAELMKTISSLDAYGAAD
jgi:hypothetical protein